jgi:hypothetical protein
MDAKILTIFQLTIFFQLICHFEKIHVGLY